MHSLRALTAAAIATRLINYSPLISFEIKCILIEEHIIFDKPRDLERGIGGREKTRYNYFGENCKKQKKNKGL